MRALVVLAAAVVGLLPSTIVRADASVPTAGVPKDAPTYPACVVDRMVPLLEAAAASPSASPSPLSLLRAMRPLGSDALPVLRRLASSTNPVARLLAVEGIVLLGLGGGRATIEGLSRDRASVPAVRDLTPSSTTVGRFARARLSDLDRRPAALGTDVDSDFGDAAGSGLPSGPLPVDPLSRQEIQAGIAGVRPSVDACFERFGGAGTVLVTTTVSSPGRVADAEVGGLFAGTPTGACIAGAMRQARFRDFCGPPLRFTYPFIGGGSRR